MQNKPAPPEFSQNQSTSQGTYQVEQLSGPGHVRLGLIPRTDDSLRELIDTMLLVIDELRLLRERLAEAPAAASKESPKVDDPKMLDVNRAAGCLGVSTSFIRNLVAQRMVVHYKLGGRVMFRREEIDQFVEQNKRDLPGVVVWQLQGRRGKSPRRRALETTKPARTVRSTPPKMSKQEIAEKRWTVAQFAERWFGLDSGRSCLSAAHITLSDDAEGVAIFRYGDLVSWMENTTPSSSSGWSDSIQFSNLAARTWATLDVVPFPGKSILAPLPYKRRPDRDNDL